MSTEFGGVDYDCRCCDSVDYVGHLHVHLSNRFPENTYRQRRDCFPERGAISSSLNVCAVIHLLNHKCVNDQLVSYKEAAYLNR